MAAPLQVFAKSLERVKSEDDTLWRMTGVVTDGTFKAQIALVASSIPQLQSQIRAIQTGVVNAQEMVDLAAAIAADPNFVFDVAPPPPTPEQEARDAFIKARLKLRIAILQLADECGPTADDIAQLKKDAQTLYTPEYLGIA